MSQSRSIYILWGRQLDAVAATIFATELRRVGLSTRLVGMQARPARSQFGVVLIPDLALDDALAAVDPIACLIVPGQWKDVEALLYDPRLLELINRVHRQDGLFFIGGHPGAHRGIYEDRQLLSYPQDGSLLTFAQNLAHSLVNDLTPSSQSTLSEAGQRVLQPSIHRGGDHRMGELIRVAANSQPAFVAGAIANTIRQHRRAEVQAIGVSAVNQMMKAAIIARRYLSESNLDLLFVPDFIDVFIDEKHLTALRLSVWGSDQVRKSDDNGDPLLPL